jgi:hypothetical protein
VLGRELNQGDDDGQTGRHFNDVKLDNRSRTLLPGNHGDQSSDKAKNGLPTGVTKRGVNKYEAQITFLLHMTTPFQVSLKRHPDADTAARAFQSVSGKRPEITKQLEKMTDREEMIAHVKSYISL